MSNDNKNKPASKPLTRRAQLEYILQQVDRATLDAFIVETALRDAGLLDTLLIHFADLLGADVPQEAKYNQTLHGLIDKYLDGNGYINQRSANQLAQALENLLETARKATTRRAIPLICAWRPWASCPVWVSAWMIPTATPTA
ncbi:MAG: hypothetical protein R3E89_12795 [Thiolinea sp.]